MTLNYRAQLTAGNDRKKRDAVYLYDPKFDVKITFQDELKRTDVIAWLMRNGIHKHSLNGFLYLRKKKF